jgi:hypothetical protein
VVARNFAAVDDTLAHLHQVAIPAGEEQISDYPLPLAPAAASLSSGSPARCWRGAAIDPGLHAAGGRHYPTATSRFERDIAREIPIWQSDSASSAATASSSAPWGAAGQVLPSGLAGNRPEAAVGARHRQGLPRQPLHIAALSGGLHRLRPVRAGLSGAGRSGCAIKASAPSP